MCSAGEFVREVRFNVMRRGSDSAWDRLSPWLSLTNAERKGELPTWTQDLPVTPSASVSWITILVETQNKLSEMPR